VVTREVSLRQELIDFLRRPVKTGLTGCIYRSDWLADPELGQACLWPAHEQVLRCVIRSHVNTFLAIPLGTKKLSLATMADGKGNLSEIDSRNIITTKPDELPEESRKAAKEF
jgi:hypothetical protein